MIKYIYGIDNRCYLFYGLRNKYCSLHGEYIGQEAVVRLIKISGKTSNNESALSLSHIKHESLQQIIESLQQVMLHPD